MGLSSQHTLRVHCDIKGCAGVKSFSAVSRDECKKLAVQDGWFLKDNPSAMQLAHYGITAVLSGVGMAICPTHNK